MHMAGVVSLGTGGCIDMVEARLLLMRHMYLD